MYWVGVICDLVSGLSTIFHGAVCLGRTAHRSEIDPCVL